MFFTRIHVPHAHAHVVAMHEVHGVTSQADLGERLAGFSVPPQLSPDRIAAIARGLARD